MNNILRDWAKENEKNYCRGCEESVLTSYVIYYWTNARQHGIYLLILKIWIIVKCSSKVWIGLAIMVYQALYHALQIWSGVSVLFECFFIIFAIVPLLRRNSATINQSKLRNFSAYIITGIIQCSTKMVRRTPIFWVFLF